jgi:TPR repeat protein
MKKTMIALLLGIGMASSSYAGVKEGLAAYKANNFELALKELRPAAMQGNATAQNELGTMYQYGKGVPQDYVQAISWYRKAADQGDVIAQYNLGFMYKHGYGVDQDYQQAKDWYLKAATQGDDQAMNNLGDVLDLLHDPAQAMAWYKKSASLGNGRAMYNIAQKFDGEGGSSKDLVLCYALLKLTATIESASRVTDDLDAVSRKMSKAEITDGDKLMLQLQAKNNFIVALDRRVKNSSGAK